MAVQPETIDRSTIVQTAAGALRGTTEGGVHVWRGVGYAEQPVGPLRFRAPQPLTPWSGVRDATRFGGRCTQGSGWDPGYEQPIANEDCLYLNVWQPARSGGPRPVVVFVHGGPGVGCTPWDRRLFDPSHFRVVLVDQRGTGGSNLLSCGDDGDDQDGASPAAATP